MSVAVKKRSGGQDTMPVKELPMPPVQVQRPDSSGGSTMTSSQRQEPAPVPQIANVLKF